MQFFCVIRFQTVSVRFRLVCRPVLSANLMPPDYGQNQYTISLKFLGESFISLCDRSGIVPTGIPMLRELRSVAGTKSTLSNHEYC